MTLKQENVGVEGVGGREEGGLLTAPVTLPPPGPLVLPRAVSWGAQATLRLRQQRCHQQQGHPSGRHASHLQRLQWRSGSESGVRGARRGGLGHNSRSCAEKSKRAKHPPPPPRLPSER